jgi:CubicO group peptidase (beta-lactamase class C family)
VVRWEIRVGFSPGVAPNCGSKANHEDMKIAIGSRGGQAVRLFCVFGLVCCAIAGRAAGDPDFAEAAAILKRGIADHAFPGCTVVVGTRDKMLWSEAFGCLDYEHRAPATKQTLYDLASVTKVTGTTSVFMQLVKQGKVQISDPVSKYLPEFLELAPTADDRIKRMQITVEHLLTHTAGLG